MVRPQGAQGARHHLGHRPVVSPRTPPTPVRRVLERNPDGRREPQAFFCTNTEPDPAEIIALFVRRWQIEVAFTETRAHLGVETPRQWSD